MLAEAIDLGESAGELRIGAWTVPPGYGARRGFGNAAVRRDLEGVNVSASFGLKAFDFAAILFSLAGLFGGLVIEALLLDGEPLPAPPGRQGR